MSFVQLPEGLDGEEEQVSGGLLLVDLLLEALDLPDLVSHDLVHVVDVVASPFPGLREEDRSVKNEKTKKNSCYKK